MPIIKPIFANLVIIMLTVSVAVGQSACLEQYAGGKAPVITNQKLATKYRELCNDGYAVGHSGLSRTPLWSAEYLTRDRLNQAKGLPRTNNFRLDPRLPTGERSELSDYARSGYDRGHMSPSADFSTPESQSESFLLSNIIPQNPENNRGLHEGIESAVRKETKRRGALNVITGPIYLGSQVQALKGRVIIPAGIFKCIYDAVRAEAGCYTESNAPGTEYNVATVAEVEQAIGINLFPAMPAAVKGRAMKMPEPKSRR